MHKVFIFMMEEFCRVITRRALMVAIICILAGTNMVQASEKNGGVWGYDNKIRVKDPRINMYDGNNITGNFDVRILPFDPHKRLSEEESMRNTLLSSRTLAGGSRGIDISRKAATREGGHSLGVAHIPFAGNHERPVG